MSDKMREWIMVALVAGIVGVLFALINQVPWPTCDEPKHDGYDAAQQNFSLIIGGSMLLAGCQR
jgi:hypothetical protein